MAKSIRSKRKRKMRQVKRVRYAKRELDTLKKVVEDAKASVAKGENELYTVVTKDELEKLKEEKESKRQIEEAANSMETNQSRKFDKKTKRDEHGQYPVWMNQRAIQKQRGKKKKSLKPLRGRKKLKAMEW